MPCISILNQRLRQLPSFGGLGRDVEPLPADARRFGDRSCASFDRYAAIIERAGRADFAVAGRERGSERDEPERRSR